MIIGPELASGPIFFILLRNKHLRSLSLFVSEDGS